MLKWECWLIKVKWHWENYVNLKQDKHVWNIKAKTLKKGSIAVQMMRIWDINPSKNFLHHLKWIFTVASSCTWVTYPKITRSIVRSVLFFLTDEAFRRVGEVTPPLPASPPLIEVECGVIYGLLIPVTRGQRCWLLSLRVSVLRCRNTVGPNQEIPTNKERKNRWDKRKNALNPVLTTAMV